MLPGMSVLWVVRVKGRIRHKVLGGELGDAEDEPDDDVRAWKMKLILNPEDDY